MWVDGARVLPEGWVEYSTTGSQADAGYGAHWRLGASIEPSLFFACARAFALLDSAEREQQELWWLC